MPPVSISDEHRYDLDVGDGVLVSVAQDPLAKLGAGVGSTVWDAGLCLAGFAYRTGHDAISGLQTVIELGAGTGLVGLAFAKLGAGRVVLTDVPNCVPLLDHNIALNHETDRARARPLIWGDADHLARIRDEISPDSVDLILCSDVFAWPHLYQDLLATILELAVDRTRVLMAYEEREVDKEGAFFRRLHEHFAIREIDPTLLHHDYRADELHLFEAQRRPQLGLPVAGSGRHQDV